MAYRAMVGIFRVAVGGVAHQVRIAKRVMLRPKQIVSHGVWIGVRGSWATAEISDRIYRGQYETEEAAIVERTLRRGDVYLEVGAGIGFLAAIAANIVGGGRVTTVEANPELIDVIGSSAKLNGHQITRINAVLSPTERTGTKAFYVRNDFWSSSLDPDPHAARTTVPVRHLGDLLAETGATYLTIDIEGGESELLAVRLPEQVRAICVEVHPAVIGYAGVSRIVENLLGQKFLIDSTVSGADVLFFTRHTGSVDGNSAEAI